MSGHTKKFIDEKKILEDNIGKITELKKKGYLLQDILVKLGIGTTNYYRILKENPELAQPIEKSKKEIVIKIKNELLKKCFNHTLTTTKTYKKKDLETGHETLYVEKTEKEVDGDIVAMQIWLKNHDKEWSDSPAELRQRMREFEWKKKKDREELGIEEEPKKKERKEEDEFCT